MYKLSSLTLEECRVLHLEINQRVDGRSAAPHGVQQKMCRDFLSCFVHSGTLVAPRRILNEVMVVGRAEFFSDLASGFDQWLSEQRVSIKSIDRADSHSVEECVRYSLVVWLESFKYYRCGKALLKGPFLGSEPVQRTRISFEVYCTSDGEIFIRLTSEMVCLYPLDYRLLQGSSGGRWIFCLPKYVNHLMQGLAPNV